MSIRNRQPDRQSTRSRQQQRRRKLRLESLENRRVLAAIFTADFTDAGGFGEDEGFTHTGPSDEWHLSTGRGNEAGHSADTSFYFGSGENAFGGGSYGFDADGTLTSPSIDLSAATAASLSFNHFLDIEPGFDFATVSVIGATTGTTVIATSGMDLLVQTSGFVNKTFSLTPFVGQSIQVAFKLDSDNIQNEEGWYIDDVIVDVPVGNPNAVDFSDAVGAPDAEGFTTSGPANEWHLSTGRGNDGGHSVDDSFYFGSGEGASGGGTYAANSNGTLTSPAYDLTGATAPMLTFNHVLEMDQGFHTATVSVIHTGGTDIIASNPSELINTSAFQGVSLDLSTYVGQSIQVAFRFESDFLAGGNEGWYIDDVGILGLAPPPGEDFGDALFETLLIDDGPRHVAVGPRLGPTRDAETDGQPTVFADGDGDDEDGVMFGGIGHQDTAAAVNILLENASTAQVDAWIDFNADGDFTDPGEKILDDVTLNNPMQTLNYNLPAGLTAGDKYARVRLSSAGDLDATGPAADGEVEDYRISIRPPLVESIVVNDGDTQRSSLDSIRVTFDREVTFVGEVADAFQVVNESTEVATPVQVTVTSDPINDRTVVDLTFVPDGPSDPLITPRGSLTDGDYRLVVLSSMVNASGVGLEEDFVFGDGELADVLFRKYGDDSGDDSVGLTDFAAFRSTFGLDLGDSNYRRGLDANGDDTISLTDFAAFRGAFGN